MKTLGALLLFILSASACASDDNTPLKRKHAQKKQELSEFNQKMAACAPAGGSYDANVCSYKILEGMELRLKDHYETLLKNIDEVVKGDPVRLAELKPRLVASQEAWERFRKSQCQAVEVWYAGGTLQPSLYAECMYELGKRRITELDHFSDYRT
jgi:uncharacterized protein YecT (DUF1311 family)